MAKTLSQDLRCRLIAAVEGGMPRRAAAARFDVAISTAVRWVRAFRTTGAIAAKPKGGGGLGITRAKLIRATRSSGKSQPRHPQPPTPRRTIRLTHSHGLRSMQS